MAVHPDKVRVHAAEAIKSLVRLRGDILHWRDISRGFEIDGKQVLFANRVRGIFKPAILDDDTALSIRTSRPSRIGRFAKYDDEIFAGGLLRYKLQGNDPQSSDNLMLYRAMQRRVALIYFCGLADAVYQVFFPVYVSSIDPKSLVATLSWQTDEIEYPRQDLVVSDPYHSLGKRTAVNQLHGARFRGNVLAAYDFKCAFSGASIGSLLTATRILRDDSRLGVSEINNAICMSVLHSAAFEANLIGVDGGLKIYLSKLLDDPQHQSLRALLRGLRPREKIKGPKARNLQPDPELLHARYLEYKAAQS